jgi:glycerate kinase
LIGDRGARVYAAQKGAGPDAIERLGRGLDRLAALAAEGGKGHLSSVAGAGAAGGLGFGLMYFGNGSLTSGADWFLERRGFATRLGQVRLVVTGEGAFDATSLEGKLTGQVLAAAGRAGVPAALVAPRAELVPTGVALEAGGGAWDAAEVARRTQRVVERALRAGRTG